MSPAPRRGIAPTPLIVGPDAVSMEWFSLAAAATVPAAIAYSAWRKAPLSLTFAVAIVAAYLFGYMAGLTDPRLGRFSFRLDLAVWKLPDPFGHSGPWTYITSLFLHEGLFHLAFNLIFLFLFGPMLEERIGALRWGVLYLVGGIVAALGFELVRVASPSYLLLGASGALSAVFGAFGRLYPRERIQIWIPVPLPPAPAIHYVIGFIAVQGLLAVTTFGSATGVAWEAHVIGLAFGFAAAPLVMRLEVKGAPARLAAMDPAALEPLATTRELREALEALKAADVPEVRAAWLERFAAKATCPRCGGPVRLRRGGLRSPCGWRLRA